MVEQMIYRECVTYAAPHGRDLQAWFKTASRLILLSNNELWVVLDDGGAILFTELA